MTRNSRRTVAVAAIALALPLGTSADTFFEDDAEENIQTTVREILVSTFRALVDPFSRGLRPAQFGTVGFQGTDAYEPQRAPTAGDPPRTGFGGREVRPSDPDLAGSSLSRYGKQITPPDPALAGGDPTESAFGRTQTPSKLPFDPQRLIPAFIRQLFDTPKLGTPCGAAPGDPWWASDCTCACGQPCPEDPEIPCEACKRIRIGTRHHPLTIAECRADFLHAFSDPEGGDPTGDFHI